MRAIVFSVFIIFTLSEIALSQIIPFDSERWEIRGQEKQIKEFLGQQSLYLKGGYAIIQDSVFMDGIIEFDVAFTPERNFTGVMWRMTGNGNYEEFYLRPHQSGNPDANQYQPVFYGISAWQLFYGERYSSPTKYNFNQWMHIKIVVSGENAEIYIKDMTTPTLFISELMHETKEGMVGLGAGEFAGAYFSNFSFTPMSNHPLKGRSQASETAPAGTVMSWQVSNAFEAASIEKKYQMTTDDKQNLTWKTLSSEHSGIANLARIQGITKGKNTAFARLIIQSDTDQIKKIKFGFSDIVKVYFNDRLIYGGSDLYRSRDYRFLGTVGLFDELYLPLKKGENELWFAVTETLGGWGIKAMVDDLNGIRF